MENRKLLTVATTTYNHGPYIAQSIDSFLMQKTNFDFEIVIGEDRSTDNTLEVCLKYQAKYPGKVRILQREKNLGMMGNLIETLKECHGKYIAFCEGDDYWTHKHKLQKQVDFLESHPDYSLCAHDTEVRSETARFRNPQFAVRQDADLTYLLQRGNYTPTLSVVYRNHPGMIEMLEKFRDAPFADYLMRISNAEHGKIHFINKRMSIYRAHSGGVWSGLNMEQGIIKNLQFLEMIYDRLEPYREDLKIQVMGWLERVMRIDDIIHMNKNPELLRIMDKMGIPTFLLEYLRFIHADRNKVSYFAANATYKFLFGSVKEKMLNEIMWRIRS